MMMFIYVSLLWNILILHEHTIGMSKKIFSALIFTMILIPFIWAGFFDKSILGTILLFFFYQFMITQYYQRDGRVFELKDLLFALCFTGLSFLIYRLIHISLGFDQIVILFSVAFIAVVNVGCNQRIQIESAQKD